MTPAQCKAARALLGWSQRKLAQKAHIGPSTAADFERGASTANQLDNNKSTFFKIKTLATSGKRCLFANPEQDLTALPGWLQWGWHESTLNDGR